MKKKLKWAPWVYWARLIGGFVWGIILLFIGSIQGQTPVMAMGLLFIVVGVWLYFDIKDIPLC